MIEVDKREKRLICEANFKFLISKKKNIKRILDVGCGGGEFLAVCDQNGLESYGLDISNYALKKASKNTQAKLTQLDISNKKWPFSDNFFDAVCAFDVLEHVSDSDFIFSEAHRVLKSDGIFFATTPNGDLEKSSVLRRLLPVDSTHINMREERYWRESLKKAGFGETSVRGCLFFCFPPVPKLREYLRRVGIKSLVRPMFFSVISICATLYIWDFKE